MTRVELAALRAKLAAVHARKQGYRASWKTAQDEGRSGGKGRGKHGPVVDPSGQIIRAALAEPDAGPGPEGART